MLRDVRHRLRPVRRRLQRVRLLHAARVGLAIGAISGIIAALLWRSGLLAAWWPAVAAAPAAALLATLVQALLRPSWHAAAAAVDVRYQLKDRAVTALGFAADLRDDPLRRMQVVETLERLQQIDPREIAELRRSRWTAVAAGSIALLLFALLVPVADVQPSAVAMAALPVVLEQADQLEETMLEEVRELADQHEEPELEALAAELETLVGQLRQPDVDQRAALATLSEMQQALQSVMGQFDLQQVDTALHSIAAALESAAEMRPIAEDLKAGDYDSAAEKLEKFDPGKLNQKERRAVSESLARLAQGLEKGQQGTLSDATGQLAEGLKNNSQSQCKGGACKLAGLCRKQGLRKSIGECLACQLNRLSMCKGACQGNKNGGNRTDKSETPSNNWGTGQSQQPTGDDRTRIDSSRQQLDVSGTAGDGPSEREVVTAPEAKQQAARGYSKRYEQFRRQAEAVLDSEPLPLGYRQTVQTYFESIRPTDAEAAEAIIQP